MKKDPKTKSLQALLSFLDACGYCLLFGLFAVSGYAFFKAPAYQATSLKLAKLDFSDGCFYFSSGIKMPRYVVKDLPCLTEAELAEVKKESIQTPSLKEKISKANSLNESLLESQKKEVEAVNASFSALFEDKAFLMTVFFIFSGLSLTAVGRWGIKRKLQQCK